LQKNLAEKSFLNLVNQEPNLDCNNHFLIELAPIGIPIAVLNLSGNCNYNPNLALDEQD